MGQAKVLFKVLAGHPAYSISNGDIFKGSSILDLDPEERSHLGIFLAKFPGVSNEDFLRLAYNSNFITSLKLIQSSS
jgi:Fe-S cluster assembly ATP-binding protein